MRKPRLSTVENHFKAAKTVKCLVKKINIDVSNQVKIEFNKEKNAYTSIGGAVTFWKDGAFAEIIDSKFKKCDCVKCDCDKTVKRKAN